MSEIFVDKQKLNPKKISLVLKSAFLIAAFSILTTASVAVYSLIMTDRGLVLGTQAIGPACQGGGSETINEGLATSPKINGVVVNGGQFVSGSGWKTIGVDDYLEFSLGSNFGSGQIEFDVQGLDNSNTSVFTVDKNNIWGIWDANGIDNSSAKNFRSSLKNNPYRSWLVLYGPQDSSFLGRIKARVKVNNTSTSDGDAAGTASHDNFEACASVTLGNFFTVCNATGESGALEDEEGNFNWSPNKKYHFKITWDNKVITYYLDDGYGARGIGAYYFDQSGKTYDPPRPVIRLGRVYYEAPVGITFSNLKIKCDGTDLIEQDEQPKTCAQSGGQTCSASQTCSGGFISASDSSMCCKSSCTNPSTLTSGGKKNLLISGADLQAIKQHITNGDDPWKSQFNYVKGLADNLVSQYNNQAAEECANNVTPAFTSKIRCVGTDGKSAPNFINFTTGAADASASFASGYSPSSNLIYWNGLVPNSGGDKNASAQSSGYVGFYDTVNNSDYKFIVLALATIYGDNPSYYLPALKDYFLAWSHMQMDPGQDQASVLRFDSLMISYLVAYDLAYDYLGFTATEKAQVENFIKDIVGVKIYNRQQERLSDVGHNITQCNNTTINLYAHFFGDSAKLSHTNEQFKKYINQSVGDDGSISDRYWGGPYDDHNGLQQECLSYVAIASRLQGGEDLFKYKSSSGRTLSSTYDFYSPVYKDVYANSDYADIKYYEGLTELGYKFLKNPAGLKTLKDPGFKRSISSYRNTRFIRYAVLLFGEDINTAAVTNLSTNDGGQTSKAISANSSDGLASVEVAAGTSAKESNGGSLQAIAVQQDETVPETSTDQEVVSNAYDIGPDGATFDPPATLSISYQQENVPSGTSESDLTLATYDEQSGQWQAIDSQVNQSSNTVTGEISHFSTYAVLGATTGPMCPYNTCTSGQSCSQWYNGDAASLCCVTACDGASKTTNFNPSYPKIMRQNASSPQSKRTSADYSDGATPLIFSKYDAVALGGATLGDSFGQEFAREIKAYNPNTIILGFPGPLLGMPSGAPDQHASQQSYYSHYADGAMCTWQGGMANYTKAAAGRWAITNSKGNGRYDGLAANSLKYYDGAFYPDGRSGFSPTDLCTHKSWTGLDFNENGTADINESPNSCNGTEAGVREINERWRVGYDARINQERTTGSSISGKSWKVVINDGGPPVGDTVAPNNFKALVDGFMFENAPDWQTRKNIIIDWDKNGKKPSLVNWVDTVGRSLESWTKDGQNNFQKMRFNLGTTMLGDTYYGLCLGEGNVLCFWYDEFDADLGQPTSQAQEINKYCKKLCPWGDCPNYCPMVRFFERGAVIINPSGVDVTITDGDISSLSGYAGPYYRFYGGQDPTTNSGAAFGSVTLKSTVDDPAAEQKKLTSGDGIILVKNPDTYLVSDLVVGNSHHDDTTPGNASAVFGGSWGWELKQGRDDGGNGNPYYTQFIGDWLQKDDPNINDGYPARYTTDPAATATFTPNFGLGGEYEVFEWHGWHGSGPGDDEATNVSIEIKDANGAQNKTINQREKYGQWNSLGKYTFSQGESGYVKISATGASASNVVIADAVKFVFTGNSTGAPPPPPPPPQELIADLNCDKKVDVIDLGILLSCWQGNYKVGCVDASITATCTRSPDINASAAVDIDDFSLMMSCWGTNTSPACLTPSSP